MYIFIENISINIYAYLQCTPINAFIRTIYACDESPLMCIICDDQDSPSKKKNSARVPICII